MGIWVSARLVFRFLKKIRLDITMQDSIKETKRLIWETGEGGESRTFIRNAIELQALSLSASNLRRFILSPKELANTWHYTPSQRASCLICNLYNKQRDVKVRTYILQRHTLKIHFCSFLGDAFLCFFTIFPISVLCTEKRVACFSSIPGTSNLQQLLRSTEKSGEPATQVQVQRSVREAAHGTRSITPDAWGQTGPVVAATPSETCSGERLTGEHQRGKRHNS